MYEHICHEKKPSTYLGSCEPSKEISNLALVISDPGSRQLADQRFATESTERWLISLLVHFVFFKLED